MTLWVLYGVAKALRPIGYQLERVCQAHMLVTDFSADTSDFFEELACGLRPFSTTKIHQFLPCDCVATHGIAVDILTICPSVCQTHVL